MNFSDERDDRRLRKPETDADETTTAPATKKKKAGAGSEVGSALRSAYQRTLDETIPPEMLDLLGKLG